MNRLLGNTPIDNPHAKFLIDQFAAQVTGVAHALVVAADGLLMAATDTLPAERAERTAAIVAGLSGLASEANNELNGGGLEMTMVEMAAGYLLVMQASDGSRLAALAGVHTDIGQVSYQMQQLVDKVGEVALTPGPRHG